MHQNVLSTVYKRVSSTVVVLMSLSNVLNQTICFSLTFGLINHDSFHLLLDEVIPVSVSPLRVQDTTNSVSRRNASNSSRHHRHKASCEKSSSVGRGFVKGKVGERSVVEVQTEKLDGTSNKLCEDRDGELRCSLSILERNRRIHFMNPFAGAFRQDEGTVDDHTIASCPQPHGNEWDTGSCTCCSEHLRVGPILDERCNRINNSRSGQDR
mmetsp:Transcript_29938/g.44216  ORF Transcript_29938/g.44216 Transcript_29938/m.44216 type:complete len:211 (-) Transcript_29938:275-907(-)